MFYIFVEHGYGGGVTSGAALNRSHKVSEVIEGMDIILSGHHHKSIVESLRILTAGIKSLIPKERWILKLPGFHETKNSYAEFMGVPPTSHQHYEIKLSLIRDSSTRYVKHIAVNSLDI